MEHRAEQRTRDYRALDEPESPMPLEDRIDSIMRQCVTNVLENLAQDFERCTDPTQPRIRSRVFTGHEVARLLRVAKNNV